MAVKYCPDCGQDVEISKFRVKGKKRDGTVRYDKYCIEHSRIRDRIRKQKNTQRDLIEPRKCKTELNVVSKKVGGNDVIDIGEDEINSFNEFISILKEEYEKLKGYKIYVKG